MIKPLRKKHRLIWTAWAFLLPAGIIAAWLVVPDQTPVKLLQQQETMLLPAIIFSKKTDSYLVNIRSNEQESQWQLEWKNKKALTVPSAVIYKSAGTTTDLSRNELIGRIEARGDYIFPIAGDSAKIKHFHFLLYDFIHENIIERIDF